MSSEHSKEAVEKRKRDEAKQAVPVEQIRPVPVRTSPLSGIPSSFGRMPSRKRLTEPEYLEEDDGTWRPDEDLDPDDFTYEELAEIDARAKQRVRAEPVEQIEDDHDAGDRVIDPKKIWRRRPTFSERMALARHEEAKIVANEKIAGSMVQEWFARAVRSPGRGQGGDGQSPALSPLPKSWGERFAQWLTAPSKPPVWK